MKFFKKKADTKPLDKQAQQDALLKKIEEYFTLIAGIEDPAEQIGFTEHLLELIEKGQKGILHEQGAIQERNGYSAAGAFIGGLGLSVAGTVIGAAAGAAAFVIAGGALIPVAAGVGAAVLIQRRGNDQSNTVGNSPYAVALRQQHARAASLLEDQIKNSDLDKLSASPDCERLTKHYPTLRQRFEEAAKKKEADEAAKNAAQPPKQTPPQP